MATRLFYQICLLCAVLAGLLPAGAVAGRAAYEPAAPGWTAPAPLASDDRPSLQSEPAVAIAGDRAVAGWVDSRNAVPDLYAVMWAGDQPGAETRVTHLSPHFDAGSAFQPAFAVEPGGRAFAVYADGEQIQLVRYDPAAGTWSDPVQVTQGLSDWHAVARAPQVVTDGAGNLVIVWEDYRNDVPDNDWAGSRGSDIYATRCNGNTLTCAGANVRLNDDTTRGGQRSPRLGRRGSQVAVIWEDERELGAETPQVYAASSADGGQTWGANLRVSAPAGGRDSATQPAIAYAPDGTLFAAWAQHSGGLTQPADIYAALERRGVDRPPARRWGAAARARRAAGPGGGRCRRLRCLAGLSGGRRQRRHLRRTLERQRLERAVRRDSARHADRAGAGRSGRARVRLVWQDARAGNQDIYSATWQGSGWAEGGRINADAARAPAQMAPALASFAGTSYALFLDERRGYPDLWLSQLAFGKSAWSEPLRLPTWANAGGSIAEEGAQLAVDQAGVLHAVWSEYLWPYGRHILVATYGGGRWSDPVRLSGSEDDGRERFAPAVAARNGTVAVVWSERDRNGTVQLLATWKGGSGGWSAPAPILSAPLLDQWVLPSTLALTDSHVVVAWGESRTNGRGRILATRQPLQGGAWSQVQVSPAVDSDWCSQERPVLRSDGAGRLHIAWSGCALRNPPDEWPHDSFIFYARSDNGGASFGQPVRVAATIATGDDAHHNDTSSRPALAVSDSGDVMVLYPSRSEGVWAFYATLIEGGAATTVQRMGESADSWAPPGDYGGRWYGGDSAGALSYDNARQRFVAVFPIAATSARRCSMRPPTAASTSN